MHRIFTCLFGAVLFCLIFTALAFSQVGQYGPIGGNVTDLHDAAVVRANVTATSTATGTPHRATTGGSGDYVIPNLDPGVYDVKVEAASFGMQQAKGVKLLLGAQQDLNFKLAPAGASTNIEVTAQAPLLETANTQVSTAITDLDMQRLPTFAAAGGGANDYAQLALSAPGVKLDTSTLTTDLIAPGSINNRGNVYNVDGANITDQVTSGRDTLGASVDEVQEMQVLTNNYNAEYGEASGLILNVKTKSGTNGIHGTAQMYFRGRNLTASTPFYNLGF